MRICNMLLCTLCAFRSLLHMSRQSHRKRRTGGGSAGWDRRLARKGLERSYAPGWSDMAADAMADYVDHEVAAGVDEFASCLQVNCGLPEPAMVIASVQ